MSDGSLSQDEIDALMQGGLEMSFDDAPMAAAPVQEVASVASIPVDLNGLSALYSQNINTLDNVLKMLLDNTSELSAPRVSASNRDDLLNTLSDEVVLIRADFADQVSGKHFYLLETDMAESMAGKMQGLAQAQLNEAGLEALSEAINNLSGATSTFLSGKTGKSVSCSISHASKLLKASISDLQDQFVKIVYPYRFDGVGASEIVEIIGKEAAMELFPLASNPFAMGQPAQPMMNASAAMPAMGAMNQPMMGQPMMNQPMMGQPMISSPQMMAQPMMGMGMMGQPMMGQGLSSMPTGIQPVQFGALNSVPSSGETGNIGLLMDVFMEMTVELGRTKRLIKDILGMGEGTIIELDKLAGEPVDILVNHKLIAKGEVVVIDENFGVRVTEIVSPMERVAEA